MTEPPERRFTIQVLRPFCRARIPGPGAALSHSAVSRPSAAVSAQAPAMVIFVLHVHQEVMSYLASREVRLSVR
ncbi:MAG: hypothetical protein OXI95_20000 [bacterium]|nr:hypothetical protein [bacterium]MDE0419196.1 hypothetical protein [bacterium]